METDLKNMKREPHYNMDNDIYDDAAEKKNTARSAVKGTGAARSNGKSTHSSRTRKKKRNKALIRLLSAAAVLVILAVVFLLIASKREIVLTMNGEAEISLEYGQTYTESGASAYWRSSAFHFIKGELEVAVSGDVDEGKLGTYELTYMAQYKDLEEEKTRTVTVADNKAPEITLKTEADHYTLPNEKYAEEGYSAQDNYDGDITANVKSEEKNGVVYYTVSDSSGNEAKAERKIVYDDRTAPVITLYGDDSVTEGEEWNGSYYAEDNVDGDITQKVTVEGSVDTDTPGDYTLVYSVEDSYKNKATEERTVTVIQKSRSQTSAVEPVDGEKIVFLTFDDGPGPYTERLLGILAEYNVKATFFVTNQFPGYQYLIAEEAAGGHTVAVHTYSHQYSDIYSSTSAYWADFDAMNDVIEAQTGSRTDIFRFPGGSSNTVSANYCVGIMSALTDQANEMGLDYYDWNVTSGDAGGTTDSSVVAANVIEGMSSHSVSVVLMHDIHDYTVDAIPEIVSWGLSNGYTFLALEKGSTYCHHGVNN